MQASTNRTPGQLYALVIGAIYLLVGVVGFFFASEFTEGSSDDQFIIFRLNHLHNLVHVALGIGWLLREPLLRQKLLTPCSERCYCSWQSSASPELI
jgi:hypothetical protein